MTRTVTTGSDGSFTDTFHPNAIGGWTIAASWEGNAIHQEAISTSIALTTSEQGFQLTPLVIGLPILLILVVVGIIILRRR